ncbi:hypothetical protein [Streptosporangium minutum]|uniref:Uncharacterized protein n=1 Tax=Streptosporangium minutum TaxID=569862 RepID=A0A243RM75_9ACTN|nr:hypothetical protein [Streptosporangium minutum]OUC96058.1 hypothetical protein CA984_16395 [Streptosporangium minutum]
MPNLSDIIRPTDDQLDGIACIRCSATDAPMIPAGSGERGQLFECSTHTAVPAGREYGVRGTVDTAEGRQVRTYTGRRLDQATAASMLKELQDAQQREGITADAVIVSRDPGGAWTAIELPHSEDKTVEVLADAGAALSDLEVRVCYVSGYLSAVTMLAEQMRTAGVDAPIWEEYRASLLNEDEREEIIHAVKMVIRRRRGEEIRENVAFELAMRAGMLCGVELATTFDGDTVAEVAYNAARECMSESEVSAMAATVEDIIVSRQSAEPAATTDLS